MNTGFNVRLLGVLLTAGALRGQAPSPAVNRDSAIMVDFQKRVAVYLQMRKNIESQSPRLRATSSQDKINRYEEELGRAVREARKNAKQGDIFTPEISDEIRRLISIAMQPGVDAHIAQSFRHAEPVHLDLKVNEHYPHHIPLQSTPPSLLDNLPRLPQEMEYRVTGRDLVLLDAKANLIVDIIPGVFS